MDRRVIRTKRAIRNAFLSLMTEREMNKITIKSIADTADVDRKTVYNYYKEVGDILEEIENELLAHFEESMYSLKGETEPKVYFNMLAEIIERDIELYELLIRSENSSFVEKTVEVLNGWICRALNKSGMHDEEKLFIATEYITAGVFCAYRKWFKSDRTKTLKEFSIELCELVIHGLPTYLMK